MMCDGDVVSYKLEFVELRKSRFIVLMSVCFGGKNVCISCSDRKTYVYRAT